MKILLLLPLLLILAQSGDVRAYEDKAIYGEDNRALVSDLSVEDFGTAVDFSRSVLAQIPNWRISDNDKKSFSVQTKSLESGLSFCAGEKFLDLPLISACTAFLVAPDVIVTAGHCVKDKYDCKNQTWVLDYDTNMDFIAPSGSAIFQKEKSYACSELLAWSQNAKVDYAVIRLDRKIIDRLPLKIRRDGKTSSNESLMVIGHPLGMPKMLANNIFIRDNSLDYVFKTNADTFSGNSGSPVIGIGSNLVEGILVRGDDDFETDLDLACQRPARFSDKEGKGESVQRSNYLPFKYIPKI
ncbi:MAG: trypsin-like peptidase domain-containing protein [Bacteriovorax sp.]|nr:trypsin-like peptidase domain-containing protein [Bacteriovorax sp.]